MEDGYVISLDGPLYSLYNVYNGERWADRSKLKTFAELSDALAAVKADMREQQYWPDVWYLDDHGGIEPVSLEV
jgi:hypothetical protein